MSKGEFLISFHMPETFGSNFGHYLPLLMSVLFVVCNLTLLSSIFPKGTACSWMIRIPSRNRCFSIIIVLGQILKIIIGSLFTF